MELPQEILLTCGIGDFIAMTSYLAENERKSVKTIYWATRARESLLQLVPFVFPNVKNHIIVRDKWGPAFSKDFCVTSGADLPGLMPSIADWNIAAIVREARARKRVFHGSPLVRQQLCDIGRLKLPASYFVAHPYSENARTWVRDLTETEWLRVYRRLQERGFPIVVVNKGGSPFAPLLGVIDLTDKLTLLEAIEVTKGASGFIGAASLFSVIAAQLLPKEELIIKGSRDLKDNFSWFYYAPHTSNSFVVRNLTKLPAKHRPMRTVTINTVQGIGDIFWVYQKLAPYFDVININILCLGLSPIQTRAKAFCEEMLPQVGDVTFKQVDGVTYNRLVQGRFKLPEQANGSADHAVDYAVNASLESGINLRDLDPGSQIEEFVDLGLPARVMREDGLCVFATQADGNQRWTVAQWLHAIKTLAGKLRTTKISLVGADWDRATQNEILAGLQDYRVSNFVGHLELADSINVIRKSQFFLGFQSGLSVIAENYDVPQLMIYYKKLEPMMFTWCKPGSMKTTFNAMTFDDDLERVFARAADQGNVRAGG